MNPSTSAAPNSSEKNNSAKLHFYFFNAAITIFFTATGVLVAGLNDYAEVRDLKNQNEAAMREIRKLEPELKSCKYDMTSLQATLEVKKQELNQLIEAYKSKYTELVTNPKSQFEYTKSRADTVFVRIKENRAKLNSLLGEEIAETIFTNLDLQNFSATIQNEKKKAIASNNPELFANLVASQPIFEAIMNDFKTLDR